jgi:hypothetical protein
VKFGLKRSYVWRGGCGGLKSGLKFCGELYHGRGFGSREGRVFNFKEAVENGLDEDGVLILNGQGVELGLERGNGEISEVRFEENHGFKLVWIERKGGVWFLKKGVVWFGEMGLSLVLKDREVGLRGNRKVGFEFLLEGWK